MPLDARALKIPGHMYKDEMLWIYARSCELPDGAVVVEIGSYRGRSATAWYQGIEGRGSLFCVDPWDADYPEGRPSDFEIFNEQMASLGYEPKVLRMSSRAAAETFSDLSADLIFIDGNHKEAGLDVDYWLPKLMPGGMICGHDWRRGGELERQILSRLPGAELVKGSIWAWRTAV